MRSRAGLGLTATGIARLARESSRLLGLVTFSTIVGPEVRAWQCLSGRRLPGLPPGPSDREKGYIRAEVM